MAPGPQDAGHLGDEGRHVEVGDQVEGLVVVGQLGGVRDPEGDPALGIEADLAGWRRESSPRRCRPRERSPAETRAPGAAPPRRCRCPPRAHARARASRAGARPPAAPGAPPSRRPCARPSRAPSDRRSAASGREPAGQAQGARTISRFSMRPTTRIRRGRGSSLGGRHQASPARWLPAASTRTSCRAACCAAPAR